MKKLIIIIAALCGTAQADQLVNGYVRSDGTYVAPHMRSSPDVYRFNNYGSQSNGGSQRDEFSREPAYNRGNSGYGFQDNDGDGTVNALDKSPNGGGLFNQ